MMSKLDRLMMLQEEVKIAKKFVEEHGPEDMGYVNTAISYMTVSYTHLTLPTKA